MIQIPYYIPNYYHLTNSFDNTEKLATIEYNRYCELYKKIHGGNTRGMMKEASFRKNKGKITLGTTKF